MKGRRSNKATGLALLVAAALSAPAAAAADDARGAYLTGECVACHQRSGGATGAMPSITGQPEADFAASLRAYRSGERDNAEMRAVATRLDDADIRALAAYFGRLQKP